MFIKDNRISLQERTKELIIDWLVISVYLVLLLICTMLYYKFIFNGIPKFSQIESQMIALFFSVIPMILLFSYLDYNGGSFGKRKAYLKVSFKHNNFLSALIRNTVKFLPWQFGHMGTIRGMYTNFDTLSITFEIISILLLLTLLFMGIFRKDKRHLGDFLASTQVYK